MPLAKVFEPVLHDADRWRIGFFDRFDDHESSAIGGHIKTKAKTRVLKKWLRTTDGKVRSDRHRHRHQGIVLQIEKFIAVAAPMGLTPARVDTCRLPGPLGNGWTYTSYLPVVFDS